ncbi:hypothetical protein FPS10_07485 [Pseudoruegeria sp. M32A2M]|nr:hypothetical protein [Pseudoruegeria sp. M32A2M]
MLMEIRAYLKLHGSANILDLSNHFRVSPDALRGMLQHWIAKGEVVRHDFSGSCGDCHSSGHCSGCGTAASFEVYEWHEVVRRAV